jgi:hypothetical protein
MVFNKVAHLGILSLACGLTAVGCGGDGRASASKADQYRSLSEEDRQAIEGMIDCRGAEEADLACS